LPHYVQIWCYIRRLAGTEYLLETSLILRDSTAIRSKKFINPSIETSEIGKWRIGWCADGEQLKMIVLGIKM
jgi:hypothetical protein